ncbi:MAG: BACON domain-containing carbohydrate-binding protein, partial [Acidobacteriota bacterium]
MSRFFSYTFFVLLLLAACSMYVSAQPLTSDQTNAKAVRNKLAGIVRKKDLKAPFVLLTPNDLSSLSSRELGFIIQGGDPCETAVQINFGQTIKGELKSTDCRLDDGTYADFYVFQGTAGQQLRLDLSSTTFDTYLGLADETGSFVLEDDDGGGGPNSRIGAQLPQTGLYIVLANSVFPNSFGLYDLTLTEIIPCNYSIDPTNLTVPGTAGTYTFSIFAPLTCGWNAVSTNTDWLTVNSGSGFGDGSINFAVTPNGTESQRAGNIVVAGRNMRVTQDPIACVYSMSPQTVDLPAAGGDFQFTITTQDGCPYAAYENFSWISLSSEPRSGTRTITYTVTPNYGAERLGTITSQGNTLTVKQAGRNCVYDVSPTKIFASPLGETGAITVNTAAGCGWTVTSGISWLTLSQPAAHDGPGSVTYTAAPNNDNFGRSWSFEFIGGETIYIPVVQFGINYKTAFDFDGDGKADLSVFRPSDSTWYRSLSHDG